MKITIEVDDCMELLFLSAGHTHSMDDGDTISVASEGRLEVIARRKQDELLHESDYTIVPERRTPAPEVEG